MSDVSEAASLVPREMLESTVADIRQATEQLDRVLLGRPMLHRMVMIGILSRGHILLEGLPGVGKTALIRALGQVLGLSFNRVQFTPDLMPGDILGSHILQGRAEGVREMVFQPGPVFTNILLADEINRASPKTQSALLEAMQEGHVTLMGHTRQLPRPFFVLASQNPVELEGTYPLPEAQLDRFLFKLRVDAADVEVMQQIISERRRGEPPTPDWKMPSGRLDQVYKAMDRQFLPPAVARYIARLTAATHAGAAEATEQINQYVHYGASPRAAIAMAEAARGYALTEGRPSVGFEDVRAVADAVLNHRLILNYKARFDQVTGHDLVADLLEKLDVTGLGLPDGVAIHRGEP